MKAHNYYYLNKGYRFGWPDTSYSSKVTKQADSWVVGNVYTNLCDIRLDCFYKIMWVDINFDQIGEFDLDFIE